MGNSITIGNESSDNCDKNSNGGGGGVLLFLHRTWTIIISGNTSAAFRRDSAPSTECNSEYNTSQYSFCSCTQCQRDDGFSTECDSNLFGSESFSSMAPNSEESSRLSQFPFGDDVTKEKQRPPIYNPEDYALSLRKWGRKATGGSVSALYPAPSSPPAISEHENSRVTRNPSFRDFSNPMLMSAGSEMTLRQFGTVSELLGKLKVDLRLAFPSFVQEFVGDPLDGIVLLLDLLRAIQLSQSNGIGSSASPSAKISPALQRRALLDELACLHCISHCCQRYGESIRKLTASSGGLFTLAVCVMSNVTRSRSIALQLLTLACRNGGHNAVSEAMSTLRLRFGEPVRFRFLVGMLMSSQGELTAHALGFLNAFLETSNGVQKRIYIQAELEQAGFDLASIKTNTTNSPVAEEIAQQIDQWERNHLDIETITQRLDQSEREKDNLRDKVLLLERRVQILLEEKGILVSLEQCLKERCSELQGEVQSLKHSSVTSLEKKCEKHVEDEGISSSERSITPEETCPIVAESEPNIDEVLAELTSLAMDKYAETEIIPSNLHPPPPRKTKSHLYLDTPPDLFENFEHASSSSGSDSLLSDVQPMKRAESLTISKQNSVDAGYYSNGHAQIKTKSLDRIDDGLDSMVDIVMTTGVYNHQMFLPTKRDHSNVPYYFPRVQEKRSNSFLIRKHVNAGLYSGQSVAVKNTKNHAIVSGRSAAILTGKLTDLPSGLY